jgi:zinc/manganese transport system substrate-binding protein
MIVRPTRVGAPLVLLAAALTAAGCAGSTGASGNSADGRIPVATSTNVWGSVVGAVGGDAVEVRSIIADPSADPHSYESKPSDATAVAGAKLVVYNGHGYDDFFGKLVGGTRGAKQIVAFEESGKAGDDSNEHVWYDLPTVQRVADDTARDLAELAPDRRDQFTRNAQDFDARVDALLARVRAIGAAAPGAKALVTEPLPEYLLDAAGVRDVTPKDFSGAIENQSDPPAAAIAAVDDLIASRQVAVLVTNAQTESPLTRQVEDRARAAGIPVVPVTETLPQGVTSYLDWMGSQVDALARAVVRR